MAQLNRSQIEFIDNCVNNYQCQPGMYHNLGGFEYSRLTEEMQYAPVGTILEAYGSLAEALSGSQSRHFWKKTDEGIFQVTTNGAVSHCSTVVFNP